MAGTFWRKTCYRVKLILRSSCLFLSQFRTSLLVDNNRRSLCKRHVWHPQVFGAIHHCSLYHQKTENVELMNSQKFALISLSSLFFDQKSKNKHSQRNFPTKRQQDVLKLYKQSRHSTNIWGRTQIENDVVIDKLDRKWSSTYRTSQTGGEQILIEWNDYQ